MDDILAQHMRAHALFLAIVCSGPMLWASVQSAPPAHAFRVLEPGGLLVIADEVLPRSRAGRLLHAFTRVPVLAATYLVSGASTRPIPDLRGEVLAAGFSIEKEQRSHGDAFAAVVAHRPAQEGAA